MDSLRGKIDFSRKLFSQSFDREAEFGIKLNRFPCQKVIWGHSRDKSYRRNKVKSWILTMKRALSIYLWASTTKKSNKLGSFEVKWKDSEFIFNSQNGLWIQTEFEKKTENLQWIGKTDSEFIVSSQNRKQNNSEFRKKDREFISNSLRSKWMHIKFATQVDLTWYFQLFEFELFTLIHKTLKNFETNYHMQDDPDETETQERPCDPSVLKRPD